MTKKITSALLHECAEKYKNDMTYNAFNLSNDLGMAVVSSGGISVSNILSTIADSIEKYYISVPTDKDCMPIHVGDIVFSAKDFKPFYVQGIMVGEGTRRDNVLITDGDAPFWTESAGVTHTKSDTWGSIIHDALTCDWREQPFTMSTDQELENNPYADAYEHLVDRCRKLAGETDEN